MRYVHGAALRLVLQLRRVRPSAQPARDAVKGDGIVAPGVRVARVRGAHALFPEDAGRVVSGCTAEAMG